MQHMDYSTCGCLVHIPGQKVEVPTGLNGPFNKTEFNTCYEKPNEKDVFLSISHLNICDY